MAHLYLTHGLVLSLPFLCEQLAPSIAAAQPDIRVIEAAVPRALDSSICSTREFDAFPDRFLYRGGLRSARFLVINGETITFFKNRCCDADLFLHHLLHPVMAAALRQRRLLVLHASGAVDARGAVLVIGESGAGKSSTVAHLVANGWQLQTDDVSALRVNAVGQVEVMPGVARIHLHDGVAAALPFDTSKLQRHVWHREKMAVQVPSVSQAPKVIRRIVHLGRSAGEQVRATRVTGLDKLRLLLRGVYGPLLPEQIKGNFDLLSRALDNVDTLSVERPADRWTLDAVAQVVADE